PWRNDTGPRKRQPPQRPRREREWPPRLQGIDGIWNSPSVEPSDLRCLRGKTLQGRSMIMVRNERAKPRAARITTRRSLRRNLLARFDLTPVFGGLFLFALLFVVLRKRLVRWLMLGAALQGAVQPVQADALVGGIEE